MRKIAFFLDGRKLMFKPLKPAVVFCAFAISSLHAADLADPDGKPADLSKPVKVFILL